ncbi:hypothetical protein K439DRAFT_1638250 [Ramaria rubella]|nr:hypothetical protein K439DRAFT_1638227 [Ramaria rubella]KAF8579105.1 hypothetical protein K439DRAFT_1638250 [Ramaria rubella]
MSPMHFRDAMSSIFPALPVEGKAPPHFILSTESLGYGKHCPLSGILDVNLF